MTSIFQQLAALHGAFGQKNEFSRNVREQLIDGFLTAINGANFSFEEYSVLMDKLLFAIAKRHEGKLQAIRKAAASSGQLETFQKATREGLKVCVENGWLESPVYRKESKKAGVDVEATMESFVGMAIRLENEGKIVISQNEDPKGQYKAKILVPLGIEHFFQQEKKQ